MSLVRSMDPSVYNKLSERPFADLTDVTLDDEDTNSMLTDNANRAMRSNTTNAIWWSTLKAMQVAPSGGQICN